MIRSMLSKHVPLTKSTVTRERKAIDPCDAETFVFKSSKERIELLKETIDGGKLEEEWVYLDGKHNRVIGKR